MRWTFPRLSVLNRMSMTEEDTTALSASHVDIFLSEPHG